MRLLHTFKDDRDGRTFASFLTQEGIENKIDLFKITDWGSDSYGDVTCKVWIINEDDMEVAHEWLQLYLENPHDSRFYQVKPSPSHVISPFKEEVKPREEAKVTVTKLMRIPKGMASPQKPTGVLTLYLIVACTAIFIGSMLTAPSYEKAPRYLPETALFSSPVKKALYYDYPNNYVIIDKIVKAYGLEKLLNPSELPPEGQFLLKQYQSTPYWNGFYYKLIAYFGEKRVPITIQAPLFEKIRMGEVWRLFTPALLHYDVLHLFFNMIWLLVLGRQIEFRLGIPRYLLFILLTGVFTNTAQYLMSGSNFIGFSGILCAMIMFVWIRQKKAPWEGYQLLPATMGFITVFILGLAGIQLISFIMQVYGIEGFAPPIANTAHLIGGFLGYLLAQFNTFAWKPQKRR